MHSLKWERTSLSSSRVTRNTNLGPCLESSAEMLSGSCGMKKYTYPNIPQGCLDEGAVRDLDQFRDRAYCNRRKEVLAHFPYGAITRKLTDPWRPAAGQIYRNWLLHMSAKKSEKAR
jgi:hypothetical protein